MIEAKKILVVENDSIALVNIQNLLKSMDYIECTSASSGKEAIQKVKKTFPDKPFTFVY